MKLILASASRDRKKCLERAHIPFEVISSNIDESQILDPDPRKRVEKLAFHKGLALVEKWQQERFPQEGPAIIIAADTMVLYQNQLLGKPRTRNEAKLLLQQLVGQSHTILTGAVVIQSDTRLSRSFVDQAQVHIQMLSSAEIESYLLHSDEYLGRAGAYSLFDRASLFIDSIEGNPSTILGLPMAWLRQTLLEFGIDTLTF